ncbi:MAG: lysophospholipid acyltransferase family protein, partial [Myxococcota bacterium]
LRLASGAIRRGETLLIFPEGTRSRDGIMSDFKPAIGWLSLHERVDVLPMWLGGTHDALPVGSRLPKARKLEVRIGDPVDFRKMLKRTEGMSRSAAYRFVTREVERRVRALAGLPPLPEPEDPQAPESREEQPHR